MKMIKAFDPTAATSGTFDPQVSNPCGRIYLFNESAIGLQLTFQDGSVAGLPPFYFRSYKITKPGVVQWKQLYFLPTSAAPTAQVLGEAYESVEAKDVAWTEGPLVRQTNIGNAVNTVGGGANFVQNDGNTAGTNIVESTVSGDPSSAVVLTNNAHLTLGSNLNPAVVTIVGSVGNFSIKSTGEVDIDNRLLVNLIIAESGNDLAINVATGHKIALQVNSADVADINANGIDLLSGAFNPKITPVSVNGSVSGTAQLYQYMQGTVKRCLVYFNNFKDATSRNLVLPVAFSSVSMWQTSEMQGGSLDALSGGVSQTFSILTALALAGGTQNPQTSIKGWSFGMCRTAFDTLKITITGTAATGLALIEGT
jgi:hypothetical protein